MAASLILSLAVSSAAHADGPFAGAVPEPIGTVKESVAQLRIRFPDNMVKEANTEAFKVTCQPALSGFSGWADNQTVWTYDFKPAADSDSDDDSQYRMVGGSKCQIEQVADVKAAQGGQVWKAGTIKYTVAVAGPNVQDVTAARGFNGMLRETEPILFITFDGPVDAGKFFAEQNGYLNYLSSNAPSEKIALAPVPKEQAEKIFDYFAKTSYTNTRFKDRNWLLVTVKQNLIPGAQLNLTIEKQASADNADVRSDRKFTREFTVRSQFQAEVQCASPSAKSGVCLPKSPISLVLNGQVKWADIKDAYIEYMPYDSSDRKTVRSFAEIDAERKIGFWDNILIFLAKYFPWVAKYNDTILDSVVFNVNIEPQTQATIVLPASLTDLDGRILSSTTAQFSVKIGAMDEVIRVPQSLSFFEKGMQNVYLPVGVVNQNQKILIRKTGTDGKTWQPITDFAQMIQVIRAYSIRGAFRKTAQYTSPMEQLSIASNVTEQDLTGTKNRPAVLGFPFANGREIASGLYPLEVSSPSFESSRSDAEHGSFYNPKYTLAQVTDLTVHLKKGANTTLAWVTQLSSAKPVAGAHLEVYNCLGEKQLDLTTAANGLVSFANKQWATDCQQPQDTYSEYYDPENFFVAAQAGADKVLIHSSWTSSSNGPMGAPGVDWFYNDVREGQPLFHAVIGVNLVKPGQQVPVELIARIPEARGFRAVDAAALPKTVRIASNDDADTFYEFPLNWVNGKADFVWSVPADASVRLGSYSIRLDGNTYVASGDIEVAEFKVPLMSGLIAFPTQELVRPDSIPVNTSIRYANGVGAKKLPVSISYYFTPISVTNKDLPNFTFGTGPVTVGDERQDDGKHSLPNNSRPSMIPSLSTDNEGALVKDLAKDNAGDGRSVAEVLKTVDRPQRLIVRARYQDQSGEYQTLSQAKNIYNSAAYVGTNVVAGPRANARLQAAVVDVNAKNITNLSDLDVKVIRVETRVIGEELFGGLIKNTIERELKPVRWSENCAVQGKLVSCPVGALKEGAYAFQVTSKVANQTSHSMFKVDSDGRVYGPNDYLSYGDDDGKPLMPLALNKPVFKGGERAVVSFAPPFKTCTALVTLERSDVIDSFVVPGACEKGRVEVPVRADLAPNAFVSVYALTGRAPMSATKVGEQDLGRPTYRLGFANMKVNWGHFKSNVTVKTNKATYKPGENVDVTVNVKADEGALKSSTVTLVAIEEKILELKPNTTYGVLDALMQMRRDQVDTVTALERIETVTGSGNSDLPSSAKRKGGDDGGDGGSKMTDFKRKLFDALVIFKAGIPVENGVAKFSFKTNDSLTRFKIFAIATDENQKFGTGEAGYLTEQDTQSYSNIPSVATTGDSYPLRVTVQNNSSKDAKYKAEIVAVIKDANGKVIGTKILTKDASIAKASSSAIDVGQFDVGDNAARIEYTIKVYDENGNVVDAQEPPAQIVSPAVPLAIRDSLIAQTENGALSKTLVKDPAALPGKGKLQVTAAKSLVLGALSQIAQRMDQDRFADFFIESRFNRALLRGTEAKSEELKSVLNALLGYTDTNGFIKYYPGAVRGSLWLTASIVNSLGQEPWAMKLVPAALNEKLKNAVTQVINKSVAPEYVGKTPMDWMRAQVLMSRAAFALGDDDLIAQAKAVNQKVSADLAANPVAFGRPVEQWSNVDLLEKWLLEVYSAPETAVASPVYKQLTSAARLIYSGNLAQLKGSPFADSYLYSDETMESSKLLLGLARVRGDRSLARVLAGGLVNANLKAWYSDATMMSVAQGLKGFARGYEAEAVSGASTIVVPEIQATATVDFASKVAGGLNTEWTTDKATIQVTHAGLGQPWVSIQAMSAVPLTVARAQGISIDKSIKNLTHDSGFQAGDVIEVTLRLTASASVSHVAMLDPIPAGANILADAYGDYSSGQKSYSGYKLYFEVLPSGVTQVKYQYQLNNPGQFHLAPTRAEGLHMPSIFGEAPNAAMKVD